MIVVVVDVVITIIIIQGWKSLSTPLRINCKFCVGQTEIVKTVVQMASINQYMNAQDKNESALNHQVFATRVLLKRHLNYKTIF